MLLSFAALETGFLGFAYLALRSGLGDLKRALAARRWPRQQGRIDAIEVVQGRSAEDAGEMTGYVVHFSHGSTGQIRRHTWRSLLSNPAPRLPFRAGDVVTVYVSPDATGEARLFARPTAKEWFPVLFGVGFLGAAGFVAVVFLALADQ